jgi:osmotically inducible lipoprotein OsmB
VCTVLDFAEILRMKIALVAAALALAASTHAAPPDSYRIRHTGDLVRVCGTPSTDSDYATAIAFCHGVLAGAYGYYDVATPAADRFVCLPDPGPKRSKIAADFVAWANARPQLMSAAAIDTLFSFCRRNLSVSQVGVARDLTRTEGAIVMNTRLAVVPAMACALALAGCSGMSTTQERTLSGAAIGTGVGVAVGAVTGDWAWAAGGCGSRCGRRLPLRSAEAEGTACLRARRSGRQVAVPEEVTGAGTASIEPLIGAVPAVSLIDRALSSPGKSRRRSTLAS